MFSNSLNKRLDSALENVYTFSPCHRNSLQDGIDGELEILRKLDFVSVDEFKNYSITPQGMMFHTKGGFSTYFEKSRLDKEDIEARIKINKWYYKRRNLPFWFSGIALIISALSLVFQFLGMSKFQ